MLRIDLGMMENGDTIVKANIPFCIGEMSWEGTVS